MIRAASLLCMTLVFATTIGTASADSFRPKPGPTNLTLNSDSSSGKAANWRFGALTSVNAIRTSVTVRKLAYDPYRLPSFTIALTGGNHRIVFKIASANFRPPMAIRAERWVGETFLTQAPFAKKLALNEPIDVAIDWTADGKVTVKAGGESQTLAMGAPVDSIAFTAETGEIRFDPLQIGSVFQPSTLPDHYVLR